MAGSRRSLLKILSATAVAAVLGAVIFVLLHAGRLPKLSYEVSAANGQALRVEMRIDVPLFCEKEAVYLFLGEKDIAVHSCTDTWGNTKETFLSEEGIVTVPVTRASNTTIVYNVPLSVPGKHGNRGALKEDYIVFDGDQAFLLPAEFYLNSEEGVKNAAESLSFHFNFPADWTKIVPFDHIQNPGWADIYAVTKNAFAFGRFQQSTENASGLNVYALAGQEETSGFSALYRYYTDLFGSAPPESVCRIDAELSFAQVDFTFLKELEMLQPFGMGNAEPVFVSPPVRVKSLRGKPGFMMLDLADEDSGLTLRAKAWRRTADMPAGLKGKRIRIAYTPRIDRYNGAATVELRLKDWKEE
ncbi:MAG: hypothetical protein LBU77_03295 [Clostridiales bacterium]|jgi:hypothetical protein|nr:hypothetical protein [Clostridiales bacterium]